MGTILNNSNIEFIGEQMLFDGSKNISNSTNEVTENKEKLEENILLEKTRAQLIDKSKKSDKYRTKGRENENRYTRRTKSKIAASVADYNRIDMNAFFKGDILEFGVNVHGETSDYVVTVIFENLLQYIQREVKRNKNLLEFKCIVRAIMDAFNRENVYVGCSCLHPDTKIKLLDGTTPTVAEMEKRFAAGEKLYVYSTDENGDFKPGEVEKVWVTKKTGDFIKITLDNGEEILTTPEHPYMLRDGSYKLAADLHEEQLLMPSHQIIKIEHITLDETPVYDIKVKKWENFLVDAGVILHNCPDYKYRQQYWATKGEYNSLQPQLSNGKMIANPNDTKGAGCKHVNLVLSNLNWALKLASTIHNYIKYCKQNMQNNYAMFIFPVIYGQDYEEAIQMSVFDYNPDGTINTDLLDDPETINLANAIGKVSGRFRSDIRVNNMRNFQFDKDEQIS